MDTVMAPDPRADVGTDAVCMEGVSKSFGGVRALHGVDLRVARGEIHVIGHDAAFFVTRQRLDGFRTTLQASIPRSAASGPYGTCRPRAGSRRRAGQGGTISGSSPTISAPRSRPRWRAAA